MRYDDPRNDAEHFVYIIWRKDEALYVGMTMNPEQRLSHWRPGARTGYFPAATHVDVWAVGPGRTNAEWVERETIRALDPTSNTRHSPRRDREARLWTEYYEWAHAYDHGYNPEPWTLDQATADARFAAIGYTAPDVQALHEKRRQQLHDIVNAIGGPAPEAGAA